MWRSVIGGKQIDVSGWRVKGGKRWCVEEEGIKNGVLTYVDGHPLWKVCGHER